MMTKGMSAINDGGPAFPNLSSIDPYSNTREIYPSTGMTLRDYFASSAIPALLKEGSNGIIINYETDIGISPSEYIPKEHWPIVIAKCAYKYADALLAEREKVGAA